MSTTRAAAKPALFMIDSSKDSKPAIGVYVILPILLTGMVVKLTTLFRDIAAQQVAYALAKERCLLKITNVCKARF